MSGTHNDIAKLIAGRRTIHQFKPDPAPDRGLILQAIELACWAPNHHLTEPWHFYLPGEETVEALCALNREIVTAAKGARAGEAKYRRWRAIPGWLVVSCRKSADEARYREDYAACCCAIQNLLLYLWQQGIGTKWVTGAIIYEPRFYEVLRIDVELENMVGLIWHGFADKTPQTTRKPARQVLTELP